MRTTRASWMLVLLLFVTTNLSASDEYRRRQLGLNDRQNIIVDAFRIRDLAYVYSRDAFPDGDDAGNGLSKLIPVSQADEHGRPGPLDMLLFEKLMGAEHRPETVEVAAVHAGGQGFVWRTTYNLFPAKGGFSGVPFQFIGYVNHDGAEVQPKRYLCGRYPSGGLLTLPDQMTIFSVMSFDDLAARVDPAKSIHGDEAQRLAKEAINSLTAQGEQEANDADPEPLNDGREPVEHPAAHRLQRIQFRYRSQAIDRITVAVRDAKTIQVPVWKVEFINSKTPQADIMTSAPLSVWVTTDGIVSRLSYNWWDAKPCRPKP